MGTNHSFSVNLESPIAVYVQIENQIQFAIASGRLQPGDTLPSVREMSAHLNVNPNTVTKAYRDLELMQMVYTRRGVGVRVKSDAPKLCRSRVRNMVKAHLTDAVAECLACGFPVDEIQRIVNGAINRGMTPYTVN